MDLFMPSPPALETVTTGNRQVWVAGRGPTKRACGAVVQQGESSQAWIKADRFPRYSLLLTKMKRCPPNIRKRTSSFQRRISLQNVSHTNTHTAGPLVARVSFPPVFETATSLAECRTTSKLPNISFSCAYLAVFNLKADLTPLQIT
jgi:hypothetical protein